MYLYFKLNETFFQNSSSINMRKSSQSLLKNLSLEYFSVNLGHFAWFVRYKETFWEMLAYTYTKHVVARARRRADYRVVTVPIEEAREPNQPLPR